MNVSSLNNSRSACKPKHRSSCPWGVDIVGTYNIDKDKFWELAPQLSDSSDTAGAYHRAIWQIFKSLVGETFLDDKAICGIFSFQDGSQFASFR